MANVKETGYDYINFSYAPDRNDIIARYYLEPAKGVSMQEAIEHISSESSIGTWTTISTMEPKIAKELRPQAFRIHGNIVDIAYPIRLFENGSIPQLLSALAGNIFGMKAVNNLRLMDLHFPKKYLASFKGPSFGIKGVRHLLKVYDRPLVGTIVKPKVGLNSLKHAKVAYESWVGGLDLVKDDENLTSMSFNKFNERIEKTLTLRDRAEDETGERKMYMANVTAETLEMLKRSDIVNDFGGEYVMIDILTAGFSALQTLRDHVDARQVIHAHRAMHAAFTRNPKHGMSMVSVAKVARLIGVDQLHVGTAGVGKMHSDDDVFVKDVVANRFIKENDFLLDQDWLNIKPTFPVASGGLHPGIVDKLVKVMGKDIIAQFGGGCHGHPDGTRAGAKAIRDAIDAVTDGKSLKSAAKHSPELAKAIEKWGTRSPN